jgi:hypothetical protein
VKIFEMMAQVARTGRKKNAHKILVATLERRDYLGDVKLYGRITLKLILNESV